MNSDIPGFYPSIISTSKVTESALRLNELRSNKHQLFALIADPAKKGVAYIESVFFKWVLE